MLKNVLAAVHFPSSACRWLSMQWILMLWWITKEINAVDLVSRFAVIYAAIFEEAEWILKRCQSTSYRAVLRKVKKLWTMTWCVATAKREWQGNGATCKLRVILRLILWAATSSRYLYQKEHAWRLSRSETSTLPRDRLTEGCVLK